MIRKTTRHLVATALAVLLVPGLGAADALLWSTGGETTSWEYGANGDGASVYSTNLAGNYGNSECGYVQSPALPGALFAADPTLTLQHSYTMESGWSTAYDGGAIAVSYDGGSTWTGVNAEYDQLAGFSIRNCFEGLGFESPGVFTGTAEDATTTVTLENVDPAGAVVFRFAFASDSSVTKDGWELAGVSAGGVDLLPFLGLGL